MPRNSDDDDPYNSMVEGIRLSFHTKPPDLDTGRKLLETAAIAGRTEAWMYLGKSYAISKNYEMAASAYEHGVSVGEGPCSFRLALLHINRLIPNPEPKKHLENIKVLASRGHLPSQGYLNQRRLKGKEGLLGIVYGVLNFIPFAAYAIYLGLRDPHHPKLQQ